MSTDNIPLLSVRPEEELFIEIPRDTGGATATVLLKNIGNSELYYKLESSEPQLYYFQPSYGSLGGHQRCKVDVFLLSFSVYPPENKNHELMIHSMLADSEKNEDVHQLLECINPSKIRTQRLKCIPWVRGIPVIEPKDELVFEGSFTQPFSSKIWLFNPSQDYVKFNTKSTSYNLTIFPKDGTIHQNSKRELLVIRKALQTCGIIPTNDTITIHTAVYFKNSRSEPRRRNAKIKCVYNVSKTASSVTDTKSVSDALLDPD
ncbi:unnamed protein product [Dicrocoelium dendriticum]|nr:unnamed protein product [Dicrocoelium dendriticum]